MAEVLWFSNTGNLYSENKLNIVEISPLLKTWASGQLEIGKSFQNGSQPYVFYDLLIQYSPTQVSDMPLEGLSHISSPVTMSQSLPSLSLGLHTTILLVHTVYLRHVFCLPSWLI